MQTLYMDNASTSFPKAPDVGAAMARYLGDVGVNVARGGYASAFEAEERVLLLRETLCRMFHSDCTEGCILTSGATFGLNMALKGCLRSGDRVLVSSLEHNAVMRPLHQIGGLMIEATPCDADGVTDMDAFRRILGHQPRMVCVTHASTVCGTVLPIEAMGEACRAAGVPFVVDASQTVGHLPIDCRRMHIDALIFSAHKGLLGPQGIGAALLTRRFAQALAPFVTGGTGSRSDQEVQPNFLPDKLEAGTPNLPGVYGFQAALDFLTPSMDALRAREQRLTLRFADGAAVLPNVRLVGRKTADGRVGVFSIDFLGKDNAEIATALEGEYGVLTRCGLHCAPCAHRALGTFPRGTVRFSIGWKTTEEEIDRTLLAVDELSRKE